jgi:hypothetical protein
MNKTGKTSGWYILSKHSACRIVYNSISAQFNQLEQNSNKNEKKFNASHNDRFNSNGRM